MEKEQKKKLYKMGLPIIMGAILLIGVSYAWLTLTLNGTKTNVLKAGTLSLTLTDTATNGINMEGQVPMLDEVGVTISPYSFTLHNGGTVESGYTIYLDDVSLDAGETKLPDTVIKYNLVKDNISKATALLSKTGTNPNRILDSGVIKPDETYTYDLRLWLDKNMTTTDMGKVFKGKIRVVAEQIKEKAPAPEKCFNFDESTGTITKYLCTLEANDWESLPEGIEEDITDVIIPKTINGTTVTSIGSSAFSSCGLTSVVFPNSVTSIGNSAFGSNQLTNVVIPSSVTSIGEGAFTSNQLTNVVISGNVTSIGEFAFSSNVPLNVEISEGVTSIGKNAFYDSSVVSVTIPNTVTSIGDNAFNMNQLTSVVIPSSVTSIGNSAFGYNQLTSVVISEGVTSIGSGAFAGNQLTNVTIPGSVTSIGSMAFSSNGPLSVEISEGVTSIGKNAFYDSSVVSVIIPNTVTSIESGAFYMNGLKSLVIPSSVTSIGAEAFYYNNLTSVIIKGKSSKSDFTIYNEGSGTKILGWASGYSDSNITWQP